MNYKRIGKDMDFPPDTGIIIETPGFLPNLTGMRNLELLASLRKKIDKKAVAEAIRAVGLDPEMKACQQVFPWHEAAPWHCTGTDGGSIPADSG